MNEYWSDQVWSAIPIVYSFGLAATAAAGEEETKQKFTTNRRFREDDDHWHKHVSKNTNTETKKQRSTLKIWYMHKAQPRHELGYKHRYKKI